MLRGRKKNVRTIDKQKIKTKKKYDFSGYKRLGGLQLTSGPVPPKSLGGRTWGGYSGAIQTAREKQQGARWGFKKIAGWKNGSTQVR